MNNLLYSETDFGLNLLRQQHNLTQSFVFSPLSICFALSVIHVATNGITRQQIRQSVIKNSRNDEEFENYFSNITNAIMSTEYGTQVMIANHLFSRDDVSIKQSYLEKIKKLYNSGVTSLNFNDSIGSAHVINTFIRENTGGHIKEIINSNSIDKDQFAILTNALYFKSNWLNKFKIYKNDFHISNMQKRRIEYLYSPCLDRKYAENDEFQFISLPYKDETFSMNLFVPKKRFGLIDALKKLDSTIIQQFISNSTNTLVSVAVPKLKIETEWELNEALENIGIQNIFSPTSADFGNMTDVPNYVSKFNHKATIEFDEKGTKAYAVSRIETNLKSGGDWQIPNKSISANHPFFFVLTKDNHPLFIGIYY